MISYIPLTFFGVIAAVGLAFFVHGFVNRQKIYAAFGTLASKISGQAGRTAIWAYPYLSGTFDGRPVKIFFHTSENHTVSVLNLVVEMGLSSRDTLVLLQKEGFRDPKPEQKAKLEEEVGPMVPVQGLPFDVRSPESARALAVLSGSEIRKELSALTQYNQILLWDGTLIASKQFDGVAETLPEQMTGTLNRIQGLCKRFESLSPDPAIAPGTLEGQTA
ncbi:MAG: hypothetical protein VST70_03135 [Nitrospirota bacterium]|nr:hypothetical protein [Nitrospirota bacterium]